MSEGRWSRVSLSSVNPTCRYVAFISSISSCFSLSDTVTSLSKSIHKKPLFLLHSSYTMTFVWTLPTSGAIRQHAVRWGHCPFLCVWQTAAALFSYNCTSIWSKWLLWLCPGNQIRGLLLVLQPTDCGTIGRTSCQQELDAIVVWGEYCHLFRLGRTTGTKCEPRDSKQAPVLFVCGAGKGSRHNSINLAEVFSTVVYYKVASQAVFSICLGPFAYLTKRDRNKIKV